MKVQSLCLWILYETLLIQAGLEVPSPRSFAKSVRKFLYTGTQFQSLTLVLFFTVTTYKK